MRISAMLKGFVRNTPGGYRSAIFRPDGWTGMIQRVASHPTPEDDSITSSYTVWVLPEASVETQSVIGP